MTMKKIHATTKILLLATAFAGLFLIAPVATHAQTTSCSGWTGNQWPYGTTLWAQTYYNQIPSTGAVADQCTASCQSEEVALGQSLTCGLEDVQTQVFNALEDDYYCNYGTGLAGVSSGWGGSSYYAFYGESCYYTPAPVNNLPNPVSIWGPTTVYTNQTNTWGFSATDPDGNNVLYYVSVPGVGAFQTGYVPSGTAQYESWAWSSPGTYTISAVSYDGSLYSYWSSYTVNVISPPPPPPPPPDLTTYTGANLTGTPGVPVTFSNVIQNIGGSSTGASFTNTAQICDGGCATLYAERYANAGPLNPQGTQTVSGTYTFNTPGTYYYRFCADGWANTIAESNEGNNCANYATITVSAPLPDLTAGTPPNLTLTAGQSYLFTSTINNVGGSATSGGFWNMLRICTANCTPYDDHSQEGWANTLAAGGSTGIGANGTAPTTPGTYYYEIYPNNNTAFQNIVAESNYANDYSGPWATLTVVAAPTPTCSLSANPTSISNGQSSTLTWTSTNTTSTTGSGFSTGGAPSGSISVTPATLPMSYDVTCIGSGGTQPAAPVTLGNSCAGGSLTETITAVPQRLGTAGNTTVTYSASNVQGTSCAVTGTDGYSTTYPTNACAVASTVTVHAITKQTTYTITCDGVSKSVIVNLDPSFKEF